VGKEEGEGDERVAALLSDGRLAVVRAVEKDLWEETLEVRRGGGGGLTAACPGSDARHRVIIRDQRHRDNRDQAQNVAGLA
jgi:hypothetical protein